jgi:hypothetical protein
VWWSKSRQDTLRLTVLVREEVGLRQPESIVRVACEMGVSSGGQLAR